MVDLERSVMWSGLICHQSASNGDVHVGGS